MLQSQSPASILVLWPVWDIAPEMLIKCLRMPRKAILTIMVAVTGIRFAIACPKGLW